MVNLLLIIFGIALIIIFILGTAVSIARRNYFMAVYICPYCSSKTGTKEIKRVIRKGTTPPAIKCPKCKTKINSPTMTRHYS